MAYFLLKTEPSVYSYDDLERDRKTVWDGITNPLALKHVRSAQKGDLAVIYHTGDERRAVGIAEIASAPYPDPQASDEKLVVFDVKPKKRLAAPVGLDALKKNPAFRDSPLLRMGRLSVVPLGEAQWKELLALGRTTL